MMSSNGKLSKPLAIACVVLAGFFGWMLSDGTAQRRCSYDCAADAPIDMK